MKSILKTAAGHLFWQLQITVATAYIIYLLFTRPDASLVHYLTSMAGMAGALTFVWAAIGLSSLPGLMAFRVSLSRDEKRQYPIDWKFCLINGPATLSRGIDMVPDPSPKRDEEDADKHRDRQSNGGDTQCQDR